MKRQPTTYKETFRTRFSYRSGRYPITLLDMESSGSGLTVAEISTGLQQFASSIHPRRPCYAQALQRFAQQISENVNASQAVSSWTAKPEFNKSSTESPFTEHPFVERMFNELIPPEF